MNYNQNQAQNSLLQQVLQNRNSIGYGSGYSGGGPDGFNP